MDDLWKVFKSGDWPYENTIRPKQRPGIRIRPSGEETILCLPQNSQEFSLNHSGLTLWELCDGRHTVGEIFLKLCHCEKRPEHELVADMTKNFLQLHQAGALELLGMEEPRTQKARTIDLRDITFYVINCPGDDEKRDFIQQQLFEKRLTFNFINGVKCSPSYVGIALSHLKTLRLPEAQAPFAILEDDCQFTNAFRYQYEVPDTTDALYLGVSFFGTETPGKVSKAIWRHTQYRQYNKHYLRVFNMLGTHAIVYLSERFRQSVIVALLQALTNPNRPYPADIGYSLLQTSHLVLTPNDPICYQSEKHKGNHPATKYSLRSIRKGRD